MRSLRMISVGLFAPPVTHVFPSTTICSEKNHSVLRYENSTEVTKSLRKRLGEEESIRVWKYRIFSSGNGGCRD